MSTGARALLDDPKVGSLLCSLPISQPGLGVRYLQHLIEAVKDSPKPVIFAPLGDRSQLPQEVLDLARENRVIVSRSADRSLRALKLVYRHGEALWRADKTSPAAPAPRLPRLGSGPQPEWLGKQVLAAAGVRIPTGKLAHDVDEAVAIAERIGFPVAMKAQAARLMHKTEAGGVELAIADEAGMRAAWQRLYASVHHWDASIVLDGMLVETMSRRGLELVVGARRDPRWGPVLLVGIGGVMIEAIGDVRLMAPDLSRGAIRDEIGKLKAAALLMGYRGLPAVDIDAVAEVACSLGQIMRACAEIIEVDINPLIAHPKGDGATALDALIITAEHSHEIDCGA